MLGRMRLRTSASFFLLALTVFPLNARVLHVDVATRTTVLNGKEFGTAGAYERITGRVYFSLPVSNPHNQRIVDLGNAVNLKNGEVEFSSDFVAVRPKNVDQGNGSMLLEVPNRGNARILALVDGGDEDLAHDAGDAWLLRNGYTIVSVGWQWDAQGEGALRFFAPVAKENGKTITGLLRGDLMLSKAMPEIPLGHLTGGHLGGIEIPLPRRMIHAMCSRSAIRAMLRGVSFPARSGNSRIPSMANSSQQTGLFTWTAGSSQGRFMNTCMWSLTRWWPEGALRPSVTSLPMPSTIPTPSLRQSVFMARAFRGTGASCATFSTRALMRMKKEELRLTVFSLT